MPRGYVSDKRPERPAEFPQTRRSSGEYENTDRLFMLVRIIYTAHRHNLRFCKTTLQVVLPPKRFASVLSGAFYGRFQKRNLCQC
ncbi:MAG: hypothetical protein BWK80_14645 [Desulfobacteraceae bacterium IS3]|nr:MAG: hypothetical protein BWK80_14645 [Desulfobacteraceae bacterium IS3]